MPGRIDSRLNLARIGERGFIKRLLPRLHSVHSKRFLVPPGDDAAVLRGPFPTALSIDGLTDGTHFRSSWEKRCRRLGGFSLARGLGWKLIGASLSDLAAMGDARDRWAMIYLGAPGKTALSFLNDLNTGVNEAAARFDCLLAGGDTVRARDLSLVSAVGGKLTGRPLTRGGARAGDLIAIAGVVGDASVGLDVLDGKMKSAGRDGAYFVRRFFDHRPMFREGAILARSADVTALLDLSDSLQESLAILADASGVGTRLELESVPVSAAYRRRRKIDARLLTGGEDYALLFTLKPSGLNRLKSKLKFSVVGRVLTAAQGRRLFFNGRPVPPPRPFEHFS